MVVCLLAVPYRQSHAIGSGWQVVPASTPVPPPRSQYGMAADVDGHIYLYGGNNYTGDAGTSGVFGDFWEYDTATGVWQALAGGTVPPLVEPHLAVDAQGNVWEFGGLAQPGPPHLTDNGLSYGLYEYLPAQGVWRDMTAADAAQGLNWPPGREDHGFAFDGKADQLVVFAGGGADGSILNDLWTYSLADGTWTEVTQHYAGSNGLEIVPREIYNVSADTEGHLYLFGGTYLAQPYGAGANAYANDLWRYDDATQTWTLLAGIADGYDPSIPVPRHYYGQTVDINGDFDVLGGYVDAPETPPFFSQDLYASYALPMQFVGEYIPGAFGVADFWRYDANSGWQDESALLGPLAGAPMVPYVMVHDALTDHLYTFGGFHAGTSDDDMEQSNTLWMLDESALQGPPPSPTATATATSTQTGTATAASTPSPTWSATGTPTFTATMTSTATASETATGTATPTATATSTVTDTATTTPSASPTATAAQIAVRQGWNLIGLPLQPSGALDARTLLSGLLSNSNGTLAALYALTDDAWTPRVIDNGGSFIGATFPLQPGTGYLLYSDRSASYAITGSVPAIAPAWQLTAGWNLVAIAVGATGPIGASSILQGMLQQSGGSVAAIYGLTNGSWSPSLVQARGGAALGQDFDLEPGAGYLLYSDRSMSYTPSAGSAAMARGPSTRSGTGGTQAPPPPPGLPSPT